MFESVTHYSAQESSLRSNSHDGTFCFSGFDSSVCSGNLLFGDYDDDGNDDDEQIMHTPAHFSTGADGLTQALVRSPSDESVSSASTDDSTDVSMSGFSWANDAEDEFGLDVCREHRASPFADLEIAHAAIPPVMPYGRSPLAVIYEVIDETLDEDEDELMAASDGEDYGEDEEDEDECAADWLDGMSSEEIAETAWAYQPKRPLVQSRPAGFRHRYRSSGDGSPARLRLVFVPAWRAGDDDDDGGERAPLGPSRLRHSFTADE